MHNAVWQKPTQICRGIILQLKTKIYIYIYKNRIKRNKSTRFITPRRGYSIDLWTMF